MLNSLDESKMRGCSGNHCMPISSSLQLASRGVTASPFKICFEWTFNHVVPKIPERCCRCQCSFCSEAEADDRRHWVRCPVIRRVFAELYGDIASASVSHDCFHLQVPLDGREIQLVFAFTHAIWRCRCTIVRWLSFQGFADMCAHFRSIAGDP